MEDAEVYPPSPNWYSPQVADWDGETFAYGSQNSVVVMRTDVNAPPHAASDASPPPEKKAKREEARNSTKVIRILYGHEKRVNAVAVWGKFVVSGSDDGTARLWDVERGAAVQMCKENGKPISALCVAAESRVVVYGDDSGGIKFWTVSDTSGTPSTSMPVGEPCFKCRVTCLKANGRVVAAAGKDGVIVLLGVDSKQRLATLGSIGGSVHSLSWCKCDIGTFLSASCESSVTVWRLSDGKDADPQSPGPKEVRCFAAKVSNIRVGDKTQAKGGNGALSLRTWKSCALFTGYGNSPNSKNDLSVAVSESDGKISVYTLTPGKKMQRKALPAAEVEEKEEGSAAGDKEEKCAKAMLREETSDVDGQHYYYPKHNKALPKAHTRPVFGMSLHDGCMITHSLDRVLALWDLRSRSKVWSISTLGGYVYAIAESPVEPGTIYFSVGDNTIRSWKRSGDNENNYDWKTYWKGLNSQVTAIAPHPLVPGLIAFGLKNGGVGVYDVSSNRSATAASFHKDAVFSLSWKVSDSSSSPALFSCCGLDGCVFYRSVDTKELTLSKTFELSVEASSTRKHTTVAWNRDGKLCALGNKDGSIAVIDEFHSLVHEFKPHGKEVRKIVWGPLGFDKLMASCSADGTIFVGDPVASLSESGLKLLRNRYSSEAVNDISFEPSPTGALPRLVSGGNNGSVIVWDTVAASAVGEMTPPHHASALAVLWGSSSNLIYSGGIDQAVYERHISSIVPRVQDPKHDKSAQPEPTVQVVPSQNEKKKKRKKKGNEGTTELALSCGPLLSSAANDFESEFVSVEDHVQACTLILQGSKSSVAPYLKFSRLLLSNREEMLAMILNEASDKERAYLIVGDTRKYIEESAKKAATGGFLAPTVPVWVLASAYVSREVLDASLALHAKQTLSRPGDHYSSILAYILLRKIPEAVDSLLQSHMFADALALAKSRLPQDDPTTKHILTSWARNLEDRKLYAQASECYLAAQLPDIAIGVLQVLASSEDKRESLKGKLLMAHIARLMKHKNMIMLTREAGLLATSLHSFKTSVQEFMSLDETRHCALVPIFNEFVSEPKTKELGGLELAKHFIEAASKYDFVVDEKAILEAEADEALDRESIRYVSTMYYLLQGKLDTTNKMLDMPKETKDSLNTD